ncbi:LOW QUALITY PROTEIN: olfactory receptor 6F1-like [Pangshura tecta]
MGQDSDQWSHTCIKPVQVVTLSESKGDKRPTPIGLVSFETPSLSFYSTAITKLDGLPRRAAQMLIQIKAERDPIQPGNKKQHFHHGELSIIVILWLAEEYLSLCSVVQPSLFETRSKNNGWRFDTRHEHVKVVQNSVQSNSTKRSVSSTSDVNHFFFQFWIHPQIQHRNITIICLVGTHRRLHTPMYYFLCNLSFLEIWYTTATIPKTLTNLVSQSKTISFLSCLLQMYFVFSLGCTEFLLLAVMAYDRYLAICHPLRYSSIMNNTLFTQLAIGSWVGGFLTFSVPAFLITRLSFCGPTVINHFFCDIDSWIELSCTDTRLFEMVYISICFIVVLGSCSVTLVSYIYIISTILRIPSAQGQKKAFSTCSAHLTVVVILYGCSIFKQNSLDMNKTVTVFVTIVTPLLNPFIYTLRNKDVKEMLRKYFHRT